MNEKNPEYSPTQTSNPHYGGLPNPQYGALPYYNITANPNVQSPPTRPASMNSKAETYAMMPLRQPLSGQYKTTSD